MSFTTDTKTETSRGTNSNFPSKATISGYNKEQVEPAEVIDIILDDTHPEFKNQGSYNSIGKAKVRHIQTELGKNEAILSWAAPVDGNIKNFPLKHEIVLTMTINSNRNNSYGSDSPSLYYIQRVNTNNNLNENAKPGISLPNITREYKSQRKANEYYEVTDSGASNKQKKVTDEILGDTFKRQDIKPLFPYEGDIIIDGRFGQSIRLGSNPETQLPNLKIRVGQPDELSDVRLKPLKEDINDDQNSIWVTSLSETVGLRPATIGSPVHLKFYNNKPKDFTGNQIILNSDRVVINAKQNEFMTFAKRAINFVTSGIFTVDSMRNIIFNTRSKTIMNSPEIYLGSEDANEPIVLGDSLKSLLEELVTLVLTHIHASPGVILTDQVSFNLWKLKIDSALSKRNFSK